MKISYDRSAAGPVAFAAEELDAYLGRMVRSLPQSWEVRLEVMDAPAFERAFPDGRSDTEIAPGGRIAPGSSGRGAGKRANDSFAVKIGPCGGSITGNSARSVLLGVYDYLRTLGCRFLMPRREAEYVPEIGPERLPADYVKRASFFHRGVCIEGADSLGNILDFIDWLPKLGYNSCFLQFKVPFVFLARWYRHEGNPDRPEEPFTYGDACACAERLEEEIRRRGLLLHKAGHGWTGEVLGYRAEQTMSWDAADNPPAEKACCLAAQVGGVRGLFGGVPANTNLCYHSREAVDAFAARVVQYARENPKIDFVHVWLADAYNNVCECADCRRTTLSDQYVDLLNEIDRRLSAECLDTRVVFLLYQELLWPPLWSSIRNPDRFVLMFAPISRTFEACYSLEGIPEYLPWYERNRVTLPDSLGVNLAYLRAWKDRFRGDSFMYDYPLGRAHYGDFGYLHISRIICGDIRRLKELDLDGYVSCQELRAALPNALPNYVMGYTLFSRDADTESLIEEYFEAAYGEKSAAVRQYLEQLSALDVCDYMNGKGPRENGGIAARAREAARLARAYLPRAKERKTYQASAKERSASAQACQASALDPLRGLFLGLLEYHAEYTALLAEAVSLLASGEEEAALEKWREMRSFICGHECEFQPYLDVYRVLEVTQKYTGFR